MKPDGQKVIDDAANRQIPPEMLDDLKKADDKLRASRAGLDAANSGTELGHIEEVDEATGHVREAEKEVEAASDAIRQKLADATKPPERK
jgi:hypothetical protein